MKSLKKILAVLIATAMVAGMGVMAFGEAGYGSITIKKNDTVGVANRTFTAYKILDATFSGSGSGTTIAYTIPAQLKDFYDTYEGFKDGNSGTVAQAAYAGKTQDAVVIEKIMAIKDDSEKMQNFITAVHNYLKAHTNETSGTKVGSITAGPNDVEVPFTNLPAGYYLIADESDPNDFKPISSLMLDTVTNADVAIIIKANDQIPKKVIVASSGTSGTVEYDEHGNVISVTDTNQVTVGSRVNFEIRQNVPNYTGYEHFFYIINDYLEAGLTFQNDIEVYVDVNGDGAFDESQTTTYGWNRYDGYTDPSGTVNPSGTTEHYTHFDKAEHLTAGTDYYLYTAASGTTDNNRTFEIAFDNIKQYPINANIVVKYSAIINSQAKVGYDPNKNDSTISYSRKPSGSTRHDTNKSGTPDSGSTNVIGEGPSGTTKTFATQITLKKIDDKKNPLGGVEFTLTGESSEVEIENQEVFTVDPNGTYYLLKDGNYTEQGPSGTHMSKKDSGSTTGYVKVTDFGSGSAKLTDFIFVDGEMFRPYEGESNADVYKLIYGNENQFESTVIRYSKSTKTTSGTKAPVTVKMIETTDNSGTIVFGPLGAGKYTLSETLVPDGFNKAEDKSFEITWTVSGTSVTWEKIDEKTGEKITGDILEYPGISGTYIVTIENRSGVELPSTGGIGTTIFYAGGAILVLLAGILLVSKRRFA